MSAAQPRITVIEGAEIFAPEPMDASCVVFVDRRIAYVGPACGNTFQNLPVEIHHVDASGMILTPGLIDAHEHLVGGSGEEGFATQTPPITVHELLYGGITTVVGCLGVDTTTKTLPALLARVRGLDELGLTAYMYTGGYPVPPTHLCGSFQRDILFIPEVIGSGEIAISDSRSSEPSARELARVVRESSNAGMLAGKAGITHFHVGDLPTGLQPVRTLVDDLHVKASSVYPTHVQRTPDLLLEAVDLSRKGVTVDIDTLELDFVDHLARFLDHGGDPARLTISSDAALGSPSSVLNEMRRCVREAARPFEMVLRLATSNTSEVLGLHRKGRVEPGRDADVLLLRRESLELVHVFARGVQVLADGVPKIQERWLESSNRKIDLRAEKDEEDNPLQ